MIPFEEFQKKILYVGIEDVKKDDDDTAVHFLFKDGQTMTMYTTEIAVPIVDSNDGCIGVNFEQSEIVFLLGDMS